MKIYLPILGAALVFITSQSSTAAVLITDFGPSATNGGSWSYNPATSTLSGIEGLGDLIFGSPSFADIGSNGQLSLTANVTTAPAAGFTVVLEDASFVTATATFDWADFIGGQTVVANLVPSIGFDSSNIVGWSLFSGGSGGSINATLDTLSAVPEPTTWALAALGATSVLVLRRRRQV
ncbi:MAG: PEP-CTERM sorting domain-containing protein [Terrimicrobiaceae bacterium]|nr:PEP-CTERM sorting domain-containing protein [Terrimicrobiaceae bacterium]